MILRFRWFFPLKKNGFWVFLVHPTVVSVLLSASVERCFVSRMRDFNWSHPYTHTAHASKEKYSRKNKKFRRRKKYYSLLYTMLSTQLYTWDCTIYNVENTLHTHLQPHVFQHMHPLFHPTTLPLLAVNHWTGLEGGTQLLYFRGCWASEHIYHGYYFFKLCLSLRNSPFFRVYFSCGLISEIIGCFYQLNNQN